MDSKIPKNIRFRPQQIERLEELETAETDFSSLVRQAVDLFLERSFRDNIEAYRPEDNEVRALRVAEKPKQKNKKREK